MLLLNRLVLALFFLACMAGSILLTIGGASGGALGLFAVLGTAATVGVGAIIAFGTLAIVEQLSAIRQDQEAQNVRLGQMMEGHLKAMSSALWQIEYQGRKDPGAVPKAPVASPVRSATEPEILPVSRVPAPRRDPPPFNPRIE